MSESRAMDIPIHDDVMDWWIYQSGRPPFGSEPATVIALVSMMLQCMSGGAR